MSERIACFVMSGGVGSRLWPLSRQSRPKQLLSLFDERSLFQTSVQRLEGLFPPERILVVTVESQAQDLQAHAPEIPAENYLIEPMPRGTASVVGLAAVALQARDPHSTMAILTSDHYIQDEALFREKLAQAYQVAQEDYLVTLGIAPAFASTGYGYIQQGERLEDFGELEAYRAVAFKEKPDPARAEAFVASGDREARAGPRRSEAGADAHVHQKVPGACQQVMQGGPEQQEFHRRGPGRQPAGEQCLIFLFAAQRGSQQRRQQRQHGDQQQARQAMPDRGDGADRKADRCEVQEPPATGLGLRLRLHLSRRNVAAVP